MDYSFLLKTQSKIVKLFNNGLKKDRLAQVYLIEGMQGTPKMQAAMYLANMILCDTHDFCGKCINCKRIEEGVHPRLFTLEPIKAEGASASIKKEQIDALEEEFSYSGLEKGPRVFIINDIEKALNRLNSWDKDRFSSSLYLTPKNKYIIILSATAPDISAFNSCVAGLMRDGTLIHSDKLQIPYIKEHCETLIENNAVEIIKGEM